MKKDKTNVRDLVNKYQVNCDRISEIADKCEKEKRERTQAETAEYEALIRENQLLTMKMQAAAAEHLREHPNAREDAVTIIRENAAKGKKTEIVFVRDIMTVSDMSGSGTIPLNIQDIIKPLVEGFILDKVGLSMPTGLVGEFVWPVYEMVEAQFCGEGVELSDTKIPFGKLTARPVRIGLAVPVSNQALNKTDNVLENIVREIMPDAIRMLLNKVICSTEPINAEAMNNGFVGPFVAAAQDPVELSHKPTFKQLNKDMKAAILETGIDGEHLCWIMSKSMQAILEGEPINPEGVFLPIVQNGVMCSLPIYTSNAIRRVVTMVKKYNGATWIPYTLADNEKPNYIVSGYTEADAIAKIPTPAADAVAEIKVFTEYIGLGDWRYQPMGMFGVMRFIVDPYSEARKDCVDFVLNADFATLTLRPEAFIIGKVAAEPEPTI